MVTASPKFARGAPAGCASPTMPIVYATDEIKMAGEGLVISESRLPPSSGRSARSTRAMSSRLPIPLSGPRARMRGENPPAFNRTGTRPPGRRGDADRPARWPTVKPVAHAPRLVTHYAPLVAFGQGRILAAGPARYRLRSHLERFRARTSKAWRGHSAAVGGPAFADSGDARDPVRIARSRAGRRRWQSGAPRGDAGSDR